MEGSGRSKDKKLRQINNFQVKQAVNKKLQGQEDLEEYLKQKLKKNQLQGNFKVCGKRLRALSSKFKH